MQSGERKSFTMHISFSSSNEIRGHCIDHADNSNRGAVSDISGSWEANVDQEVVIRLVKTYWGGQQRADDQLQGHLTQDFKRIIGLPSPPIDPQFNSRPPSLTSPAPLLSPPPPPPQFEMNFEYGNKLATVWRCSQECTFDCCSGCMEKYTVYLFLLHPGIPGVRSIGPNVSH